jgi:FHA domain
MAEKEEKSNKVEIKIPVFSVLRNGCTLKNIFLSGPGGEIQEEYEEMPVLMGRHPDCHIILDHPSISRFHLEIFAKPSIQKISIVDRSSGNCICKLCLFVKFLGNLLES